MNDIELCWGRIGSLEFVSCGLSCCPPCASGFPALCRSSPKRRDLQKLLKPSRKNNLRFGESQVRITQVSHVHGQNASVAKKVWRYYENL